MFGDVGEGIDANVTCGDGMKEGSEVGNYTSFSSSLV